MYNLSNTKYKKSSIADWKKAYIATQSPIPATIESFWQMVFQENAEIIIMLCEESSGSKGPGIIEYWPESLGDHMDLFGDGMKLTYASKASLSELIIIREFILENKVKP